MENKDITGYIAEFRATNNIRFLFKALILVLKQRRSSELIYGIYCSSFFQPSLLNECDNSFLEHIDETLIYPKLWFSRSQLIETFGESFCVHSLPTDFNLVRSESIIHNKNRLIIGEYAENSARIAYITRELCIVSNHYNQVSGVRHIHSIIETKNSEKFLVSTGDSRKFLDLWSVDNCNLNFLKRIRNRFAGYTSATNINGCYYFGTDFSNRPNYVETLKGEKYFFPEKAYKFPAVAFSSLFNRYIVSINAEMPQFGCRKTLSVFDTAERQFIFCDYIIKGYLDYL